MKVVITLPALFAEALVRWRSSVLGGSGGRACGRWPAMRWVRAVGVSLAACVMVLGFGAAPGHADAASGVCARGFRLGSYSTSRSAENWAGETIYTITERKRWCYSAGSHRVGSVYYPKPSINIRNEFNAAWSGTVIDSDAHYTSTGPDGRTHPNFPRWGHMSWFDVKMCHNLLGKVGCVQSYTYRVGIIGYWDGSKKLV